MPNLWKPAAQLNQMREAQRYHEWKNLPRDSQRASILWPALSGRETQQTMAALTGQGKRAPRASPLLSDATRGATSPLDGRAKR